MPFFTALAPCTGKVWILQLASLGRCGRVGVLAEVTLFAWSAPLLARFGPTRLLIFAALGAVVRWIITAFDPPLYILFPVQILHALSFGAAHLGAIHFIAQAVPEQYSATGQGLYAAFAMGVIMGIMTMVSGSLYANLGSQAYLVMALLAAISLVGALMLNKQWQGEQIIGSGEEMTSPVWRHIQTTSKVAALAPHLEAL